MSVDASQVFWVCRPDWLSPTLRTTCEATGTSVASAEKHTKSTGHPTMQTCRADVAERLVEQRSRSTL